MGSQNISGTSDHDQCVAFRQALPEDLSALEQRLTGGASARPGR